MRSNSPYTNAYKARHPEKTAAHNAVKKAVKDGLLVPQPCEKCGTTPTEAHHEDYTKQLEVIWLCRQCHAEHHNNRNKPPITNPNAARHPEAVTLRKEGHSYRAIAKRLKVSFGTVYKWLNNTEYD